MARDLSTLIKHPKHRRLLRDDAIILHREDTAAEMRARTRTATLRWRIPLDGDDMRVFGQSLAGFFVAAFVLFW